MLPLKRCSTHYAKTRNALIPFHHRTGFGRNLGAVCVFLQPLGLVGDRDRLQLRLLQAAVDRRQIGRELGEVGYDVCEVMIQRVRPCHLVVRGTAFVLDDVAIQRNSSDLVDRVSSFAFRGLPFGSLSARALASSRTAWMAATS